MIKKYFLNEASCMIFLVKCFIIIPPFCAQSPSPCLFSHQDSQQFYIFCSLVCNPDKINSHSLKEWLGHSPVRKPPHAREFLELLGVGLVCTGSELEVGILGLLGLLKGASLHLVNESNCVSIHFHQYLVFISWGKGQKNMISS